MRPRGEIRQALVQAFEALPAPPADAPAGPIWCDLAAMAGVGWDAARRMVDNMLQGGELIVVGHKRVPHACRPMNTLGRPSAAVVAAPSTGFEELARCWAEFR